MLLVNAFCWDSGGKKEENKKKKACEDFGFFGFEVKLKEIWNHH